ncbi:MAG: type II CRISPR-associated endonuclease Cas1 [Culicoidibacterales bacterium]
MGFRNIIIEAESKISTHSGYLVVQRMDNLNKILLNDIDSIIFETPKIRLSGYTLNALTEENIAVIICDQKHNPSTLVMPIHGNFHRSKNIKKQIGWSETAKEELWKWTIIEKIANQIEVLKYHDLDRELLVSYLAEVGPHDKTNREGLAAKVYFRKLFGEKFTRGKEDPVNWGLNYAYSLILTFFVRTISGKGYLTELGIKHINEYNAYNLACDMMEPFRPIADLYVKKYITGEFGIQERRELLGMTKSQVIIKGKKQFLPQAIDIFVANYLKALEDETKQPLRIDMRGVLESEL